MRKISSQRCFQGLPGKAKEEESLTLTCGNGTRRLSISLATWRSPFGGSGSKAAPRSSVHVQLSSPLSFLVRIRFSLISVSTLLLCFKISCYLAGLLFYPPLFLCFPPVRGQHGRRRNDQRPPFGRFVPGFFKFRLVRPVDWSVKTGRKKMAAILDQLARSMPTLPSVRLWFFRAPISRAECESLIMLWMLYH